MLFRSVSQSRYADEFDVRDEIVVVLKSDDLKASRAAANALAEKWKEEQGIDRIYYRHNFTPMADRLLLLAHEEQLTGIRRQMEELAALVKGNKQALNLNGILAEASAKFNDPYLRKSSNWQEFIPFIEEFVRNLTRWPRIWKRLPRPWRREIWVSFRNLRRIC